MIVEMLNEAKHCEDSFGRLRCSQHSGGRNEDATFLPGRRRRRLVRCGVPGRRPCSCRGAGDDAARCPGCELAANEDYWSEIQRRFDTDRTLINLNNGGVCPTPEPRARADDPRPPVHQRVARAAHVADPRAARRVGAPRPGPRVRLRRRGDRDHPQRLRGDGDPDLRHRPEPGRRGRSSPTRTTRG